MIISARGMDAADVPYARHYADGRSYRRSRTTGTHSPRPSRPPTATNTMLRAYALLALDSEPVGINYAPVPMRIFALEMRTKDVPPVASFLAIA